MSENFAYTPTPIAQITSALNAIFASMDKTGETVRRSASSNLIIAVSCIEDLSALEPLLDSLSIVHPGRFFVVCLDPRIEQLSAEISARCNLISKTEHVCSEIVRLRSGPRSMRALSSIVRANLLIGMPTELGLFGSSATSYKELLELFAGLADQIYFDSRQVEKQLDLLQGFERSKYGLLDSQWLFLAPWRNQIKETFDRPALQEILPNLKQITVRGPAGSLSGYSITSILISAWMLDRLGLEVRTYSKNGFECAAYRSGRSSRDFLLKIEINKDPKIQSLTEIEFSFQATTSNSKPATVRIARTQETLETYLEINQSVRISRPFEEPNSIAALERFFLIGDSVVNYRSSLGCALDLNRILRGFSG